MNWFPVCAPLKRYSPRLLTPIPKPSRAMLRVKSPPVLSEWPPLIHVMLSLIEKAFCLSVRSTFRQASTMLSGRFVADPPMNVNDGNPKRSIWLGAFSRPRLAATWSALKLLCRLELS